MQTLAVPGGESAPLLASPPKLTVSVALDLPPGDVGVQKGLREFKRVRRTWLSVCVAASIIILFVTYAELLKGLQEKGFVAPYFESAVNALLNLPVLPVFWLLHRAQGHGALNWRARCTGIGVQPYQLIALGVYSMLALFGSFYSQYVGIRLSNPASAITLCSSSAIFVYAGSVLFLDEKFSVKALASVLVAFSGACLTALGDRSSSSSGSNPVAGDALSLLAGALMASQFVVFNYFVREMDTVVISVMEGVMGATGALLLAVWPLMGYIGAAKMIVPRVDVLYLWIPMQLTLKALNVLVMFAIPVTSPTMVAVANLMCIPVSLVTDACIAHFQHKAINMSPMRIAGMVLVIVGFVCLEWIRGQQHEEEHKEANPFDARSHAILVPSTEPPRLVHTGPSMDFVPTLDLPRSTPSTRPASTRSPPTTALSASQPLLQPPATPDRRLSHPTLSPSPSSASPAIQ